MSSLRLEVHDIPKYRGGRGEDVDAWVFRLEELYILNAIQDEEFCIKYAEQHLAGKAATWYRSRRVATVITMRLKARTSAARICGALSAVFKIWKMLISL